MSELEKKENELTQSQRFTNAVIKELKTAFDGVEITQFHQKLCNSYFVKLDQQLQLAEIKRMAKPERDRDAVPVSWENIDLKKLSFDVMSFVKVGLDPTLPNQLNLTPYKNKHTGKYDIVLMRGYRGCEIIAKKYGIDIPDDVIVEVVYATDKFKQIKKDVNNPVESYAFEVTNDFERGKIIGGFYYHKFKETPEKNRIRVYSLDEILKRKPKYASTEFWGGEKEKVEWKSGKPVGTGEFEKIDGWLDEMCYKTLYRAAYESITIDSQKIDDALVNVLQKDKEAQWGNLNDRAEEEAKYEVVNDKKPEAQQQPRVIGFPEAPEVKAPF